MTKHFHSLRIGAVEAPTSDCLDSSCCTHQRLKIPAILVSHLLWHFQQFFNPTQNDILRLVEDVFSFSCHSVHPLPLPPVEGFLCALLDNHDVKEVIVGNTDGIAKIAVFVRCDLRSSGCNSVRLLSGPATFLRNKRLFNTMVKQILSDSQLNAQGIFPPF